MLTIPTTKGFTFCYKAGERTLKSGKVVPIIKDEYFKSLEEAKARMKEVKKQGYEITMEICECLY